MNSGLLHKCPETGCGELVSSGRCSAHQSDNRRGNSNDRGYDHRWRETSERWRRGWNPDGKHHPEQIFCANPYGDHRELKKGACVDHIRPHRGNKALFDNPANWQTLCDQCHAKKTLLDGQ